MPFFVGRLNKLFVALYKALGLTALAMILLGLFSYLGAQGFYLLSHRWVSPMIVSPLDERVLRLNTEIAEKAAARDRLAVERAQLQVDRDHAARTAAEARLFQQRFQEALRAERADRARARAQLAALVPAIESARQDLAESERAFSPLVRTRAEAMRDARLIEREAFLGINHQLSEQAVTRLALAEREVEIGERLTAVQRELTALDAASPAVASSPTPPFTTRVLLQVRESLRARVDEQHGDELQRALDDALLRIDESLGRYDQLLATLRASPWLAAVAGNVAIAFVPYDNLKHAREGAPLYGCAVGLFVCRRVGTVGKTFEGEATTKHPIRMTHVRGAMVQLHLADAAWARDSVLHIGGAPILF
jgi:hypothetical protein